MLKTIISISIAILLFQFLFIAPAFGQKTNDNAEAAKIKTYLAERGNNPKSKFTVKLRDGREVKGYIAERNADDFVIAEAKNNNRMTIFYADVAKIKKSGLSLGAKVGIAALIIGAVAVTVIAVGVKNLDDNIFPR